MPQGDIMPFRHPLGSTNEVRHGGMTAAQSWLLGHPVGYLDAGTVTGGPSDTTELELNDLSDDEGHIAMVGIACWSVGQDDGDGTVSTGGAINPATAKVYATGDTVAFWPADQDVEFITANFHDTATTSAVVPLITDINENYLMSTSETAAAGYGWGVEQSAVTFGTHIYAHIIDVLDISKAPIRLSGLAGKYLVFRIRTTQGVSA